MLENVARVQLERVTVTGENDGGVQWPLTGSGSVCDEMNPPEAAGVCVLVCARGGASTFQHDRVGKVLLDPHDLISSIDETRELVTGRGMGADDEHRLR